jgi:hypothetical protein
MLGRQQGIAARNPGFLDFANGVYKDSSIYGYVRDHFASNPKVTVTRGFSMP